MEKQKHLIILLHGPEEAEHACFAFQFAVTLQTIGMDVIIHLAGSASKWAHKATDRSVRLCGENNMDYYMGEFTKNSGKIFVCCSCFMEQCDIRLEEMVPTNLMHGTECCGTSELVELSLKSKVFTF